MSIFEQLLNTQFPDHSIDNQGFWQSGAACAASELAVSPLLHYDFLRLDGADSRKFLQGQTSCDWQQINAEQASRGACCNIKGRVLSSFIGLLPSDDCALLRMRSDICESSRALLNKYIVFSKANISSQARQHHVIGVKGSAAKARLQQLFGGVPAGPLAAYSPSPDTVILQLDSDGQRFECWLSDAQAAAQWPALSNAATIINGNNWEKDCIRAGTADVCAAIQDQFLPQQLNYQLTGAINFKKGCYTGQEVVARMQYRGKLKRRLYAAELDGPVNATPGSELFVDDETQSIGNIVAIQAEGTHSVLLAVLSVTALSGSIHTADSAQALRLIDLPYALPELNNE
ncbi:folate-binding protein YgfZ [Spongiibacter sp.]|uniref:CAF17-like 4Fe-4S cluster assembly/insertion protein YgfZ n=1 Tax=Spongiibacter sp. TaxID=2024860 RepID=UPI00356321C6